MERLMTQESAVSRACSAGPGPYLPIRIFRVVGRIYQRKLNVPT